MVWVALSARGVFWDLDLDERILSKISILDLIHFCPKHQHCHSIFLIKVFVIISKYASFGILIKKIFYLTQPVSSDNNTMLSWIMKSGFVFKLLFRCEWPYQSIFPQFDVTFYLLFDDLYYEHAIPDIYIIHGPKYGVSLLFLLSHIYVDDLHTK